MKTRIRMGVVVIVVLLSPPWVMAQSGWDLAGFFGIGSDVQRAKSRIRASDEEWKVIGPLLDRLVAAREVAQTSLSEAGGQGGAWGFGRGMGNPFGGDSFAGPSERNIAGWLNGGGGFIFPPGGFGMPPPVPPGDPGQPTTQPASGPADATGRGGPPGPGGRGGFAMPAGAAPPPGFGGPGGGQSNPVAEALVELRKVLADPNSTAADVEEKLAALRTVRQRASTEVIKIQTELRKVLPAEAEARLVADGYLD